MRQLKKQRGVDDDDDHGDDDDDDDDNDDNDDENVDEDEDNDDTVLPYVRRPASQMPYKVRQLWKRKGGNIIIRPQILPHKSAAFAE